MTVDNSFIREKETTMGFMGGSELLIILVIVIILFGAKKIPELASGLGKGIKEFKKATRENDKKEIPEKSDSNNKS